MFLFNYYFYFFANWYFPGEKLKISFGKDIYYLNTQLFLYKGLVTLLLLYSQTNCEVYKVVTFYNLRGYLLIIIKYAKNKPTIIITGRRINWENTLFCKTLRNLFNHK